MEIALDIFRPISLEGVAERMDLLVPFNAGIEDGLYSDAGDTGRPNHHVFAGVNFRNGHVDEFFGGGFGHELIAVPLLKVLNGGEADGFLVPTIESDMDDIFARSSRHFMRWVFG